MVTCGDVKSGRPRSVKPHDFCCSCPAGRVRTYARAVSEIGEPEPAPPGTWTTRYRIPVAVGSGFLTLLCCWLLFTGGTTEKWVGGVGLVALVLWVFVFRMLHRRGY